jgi:hypothetical protein
MSKEGVVVRIEGVKARFHPSNWKKIDGINGCEMTYPKNDLFDVTINPRKMTLFSSNSIHSGFYDKNGNQECFKIDESDFGVFDEIGDIEYTLIVRVMHNRYATLITDEIYITNSTTN